jgi:hypothetical protein
MKNSATRLPPADLTAILIKPVYISFIFQLGYRRYTHSLRHLRHGMPRQQLLNKLIIKTILLYLIATVF